MSYISEKVETKTKEILIERKDSEKFCVVADTILRNMCGNIITGTTTKRVKVISETVTEIGLKYGEDAEKIIKHFRSSIKRLYPSLAVSCGY